METGSSLHNVKKQNIHSDHLFCLKSYKKLFDWILGKWKKFKLLWLKVIRAFSLCKHCFCHHIFSPIFKESCEILWLNFSIVVNRFFGKTTSDIPCVFIWSFLFVIIYLDWHKKSKYIKQIIIRSDQLTFPLSPLSKITKTSYIFRKI